MATAATQPPRPRRDASPARVVPRPRKVVETVSSQGTWCCISRSLPSSPTASSRRAVAAAAERSKSKENSKLSGTAEDNAPKPDDKEISTNGDDSMKSSSAENARLQHDTVNKVEKRRKSGELNKAGEVLKTGEIAALIKQGFISGNGLDKSGNSSPFKIRLSPGRVSPLIDNSTSALSSIPTPNYTKFNSLLSTGLLNHSSPPMEKNRSSPTLLEMMVHEQETQEKSLVSQQYHTQGSSKHLSTHDRILTGSPGNQFNDPTSSDVRLTLSNREGFSVTINVHSQILAAHSRFFSAKLSERWSKQQRQGPHHVEISDCEDVEMYLEALRLMYCRDLKRKLLRESVSRVLGILKVSAAIVFEAGVLSCLEYLEAVPWAEEDEEKVMSLLSQLQLESIGAGEVLKRLSTEDSSCSEDILVRLLHLVTKGTDEKARREMKTLVSRMLRENASQGRGPTDLSKDSLYQSCQGCLESLLQLFVQASNPDFVGRLSEDRGVLVGQITRQADNLFWLVDILIDRQIADDFVRMWAFQTELATLHGQIPIVYGRYEVSRVTARLCIAVGKGQVLASKDIRFMLLQNWLQPLMDDFGWMQRACKGLDRKVVEEGISQTILTLPLKQQQTIMLAWFDRFLRNGDECPNLQRAFEIWWRRTFVRPQFEPFLLTN